jgi:CRISPR-associated endonuclease Csn1
MPGDRRDRLVQEVLQSEHEDELARKLEAKWGFSSQTAAQLSAIELEQGYCALSRRAMRKLLPGLEAGRRLNDVRKEIYGERLLRGNPDCERLPAVGKVAASLRNPVVCRALSELRKVVNAIVRRYGKPEKVRIELARDMKKGRKLREETWKDMRKNEKLREDAKRKILNEVGISGPRPGDVLKMLLADECNWECPYTGRPITPRSLLGDSPQFDIEHIVPFSRSLDNSFVNKTLCYHEENRNVKQNRTPQEAYGCNNARWAEIVARVRRFRSSAAAAKLRRFQLQEIPEDFAERQLNDTRYISRMAADYVGLLYGGRVDAERTQRVQVGRGGMTKYLRDEWNLNSILSDGDAKNRADHRHHAVDAVVIALTDPAAVQALSRSAERAHDIGRRLFVPIDAPWGEAGKFLDDVRGAIEAINVSYRVNRRISGALHEDSNYSKPHPTAIESGKKVVAYRHIRKPLKNMSAKEIEAIVDDRIRECVKAHLGRSAGDLRKAFGDEHNHPYVKARDGRIIPIHKARIRKNEATIAIGAAEKQRYVSPGSNHHMEVVATLGADGEEAEWKGDIVSLYKATQRVRAGLPVVQRAHEKDRKFKFSMAKNEYFLMEIEPGRAALYRVVKISAGDIEFQLHCDGRPTIFEGRKRVRKSPGALQGVKARKVAVDPLGNILPAHD